MLDNLTARFDALPICPSCEGARELTARGLCHICTRLQSTGRLSDYRTRLHEEASTSVTTISKELPMFEPLFKRTSTGAVQVWQIRVEPQDNGWAVIITSHGQVDGKPQENRDLIKEGKNAGKKNATTALQQATKEAESKWTEKLERDRYGLTVEESDIKREFAPMLAQSWTDNKGQLTSYAKKVNWQDKAHLHVQPKFDGHRCLAIHDDKGLRLFTRKGVEVTSCGHLVDQLRSIMPINSAIDGELYTHGVPVTTIGGYISKQQPGTENLCFMLYDEINCPLPFAERMVRLDQLASQRGSHIHLARTQPIATIDDMMNFQGQCVENGYEGAMLRHGLIGYENARSGSLLKVKTFLDHEFKITGCKEGRGKFDGMAIFECITDAGNTFEVTAPGTHEEKRSAWIQRETWIGQMLTVKYQKMTETECPVPFQPVALQKRD